MHPYDDGLRVRVRGNLSSLERTTSTEEGLRHAAVAMTVVGDDEGRACFLLTRRPGTMRRHAAQWALPGGSLDAGESPVDAALRELDEELGLRLDPDAVLGILDDYPTRSGYRITPVVVWGPAAPSLAPAPSEVEAVHLVPLAEIDRPEIPRLIPGEEPDRPVIQVPLFGRYVHAPTAAVLYQFVEVGLRGRQTRVAHFDQPRFAWR